MNSQFWKKLQKNGRYKMKKALLVLGASADQLFIIDTAHRMSLETAVVDGNPEAPGLKIGTYSAPIDFSKVDEVINYVKTLKNKGINISGVSTMGSEVPHIVAKVAKHFGWASPSEETALVATNKYEMKVCFQKNGVLVPHFACVENVDEIIKYWDCWGCKKLIIKPTDRSGSRGVRIILAPEEVEEALEYAQTYSNNGQIIIEEFVEGPQISTESIIFDEICLTPGFADRVYKDMDSFHPNIMENGGWVPSNANAKVQNAIFTLVEKAARALKITRGVAKGDVVLCPERGPMIIEMAARLSGGDFSESLVPLGTGVNYVESVIDLAMGNLPNFDKLKPTRNLTVANRYFFPPPGKLEEIIGIEKCSILKQLVKFELFFQPGQSIPFMTNHSQRAGVFIVVDENRLKAQAVIDEIYETIKFKIKGKFYSGHPLFYNYKQ
jgi:biotin carboxylase